MGDRLLDQGLLLCRGAVFRMGGGAEDAEEFVGAGIGRGSEGIVKVGKPLLLGLKSLQFAQDRGGSAATGLLEGFQEIFNLEVNHLELPLDFMPLAGGVPVRHKSVCQLHGLTHHIFLGEVCFEDFKDGCLYMLFAGGGDTVIGTGIISLYGAVSVFGAGDDGHFRFTDIAHAQPRKEIHLFGTEGSGPFFVFLPDRLGLLPCFRGDDGGDAAGNPDDLVSGF